MTKRINEEEKTEAGQTDTAPAKKSVPNLIVIADLHCGCRLGLCQPEGIALDDGGKYSPSKLQLKVWSWWREFWDEWVPEVCRGEPFAVVCNGDAVDGVHHNTTTQISHNLEDQGELAYQILNPIVEKCEGRYYHLRGTRAHGAPSGREEERLAKRLGAIPNEEGQCARWVLWAQVGRGLVNIMHSIGTSGSMAYESSGPQKELEQALVEAGRWNNEFPDVVVRSHRHRNIETRIRTYKGFATSFVTAGWQLKSPYAYRVAGARVTEPQIGGSLIRSGDEDVYSRHWIKRIERPKTEII